MLNQTEINIVLSEQISPELQAKWQRLIDLLNAMGPVAVAFSGGVDSALLAVVAYKIHGDQMAALTIHSPIESPGDHEVAQDLAEKFGFAHWLVEFNDMDNPAFVANPPDRCYHCKLRRLKNLQALAQRMGFPNMVDGSNIDDSGEYRPGRKALQELGVRSPLAEAGLTKVDIRALARSLELPVWDRPSAPCLATRFPYGTPVTQEGITQVALGEVFLKNRGYQPVRVRHYGTLARIEVAGDAIPRLVDEREAITAYFRRLGYQHITLDLTGYRSGSMDEGLIQ